MSECLICQPGGLKRVAFENSATIDCLIHIPKMTGDAPRLQEVV